MTSYTKFVLVIGVNGVRASGMPAHGRLACANACSEEDPWHRIHHFGLKAKKRPCYELVLTMILFRTRTHSLCAYTGL